LLSANPVHPPVIVLKRALIGLKQGRIRWARESGADNAKAKAAAQVSLQSV
jgi:hypothetical protein